MLTFITQQRLAISSLIALVANSVCSVADLRMIGLAIKGRQLATRCPNSPHLKHGPINLGLAEAGLLPGPPPLTGSISGPLASDTQFFVPVVGFCFYFLFSCFLSASFSALNSLFSSSNFSASSSLSYATTTLQPSSEQ